jgi:hypothetical protein
MLAAKFGIPDNALLFSLFEADLTPTSGNSIAILVP